MSISTIDFLGIGAQKAATSWVWRNLGRHRDIWMPPRKELHYFDRSPEYPSPSFLATPELRARLTGRTAHDRQFLRRATLEILGAFRHADWARLRWTLRYFGGRIDDRWYLSLFDGAEGRLTGEFTPCYSMLASKDVAHIACLFPDLKIILVLRNPIDRAWSQVRFAWTRGSFDPIDDSEAIRKYIDSPVQDLRSDYVRTLDIWGSRYPDQQIHIAYYDDISRDPRQFLLDLFGFLGVEPDERTFGPGFESRETVSRQREMPTGIRRHLAMKYRPLLETLSQRLGSHTLRWLEEAQAVLEHPEPDQALPRTTATRR